jgi:hypothetical protein
MVLYLALAISALAAAWLVSRYDLYHREPWHVMAAVIAAGAASMAIAGPVGDRVIHMVGAGRDRGRVSGHRGDDPLVTDDAARSDERQSP